MGRLKNYLTKKPTKDDVIVFDGEGGTFKIPLGDIAGALDCKGIAGFHNSIYRGANLKERWGISDDKAIADEVCNRIASGDFTDLFVGDYWSATITSEYGTETVEIVLAGFDVYMNSIPEYEPENDDYNPITRHHAVCVTRKNLATPQKMNNTHTTAGGYAESLMNKTILPKYAVGFNEALNGHIIEICDSVTTDMNADYQNVNCAWLQGAADGWDYGTDNIMHLTLLTERELYGAPAYSGAPDEVGFETSQLPLFRLNPAAKITGSWYWLKDIASSPDFCRCDALGGADYCGAGLSGGVRPRFLIG